MRERPSHTEYALPKRRAPASRDFAHFWASYAYADRAGIPRHRREGQPLVAEQDGVMVEPDLWLVWLPSAPEPASA